MGWYDSGWSYRREVTIDNTSNSNNLTEYQVKVTLNSTNFDFSKAKSDGADIRFTDDDGTTLLNHWIEKWDVSGEEAIIWVKVPSIPASSNKTIYLYYSNPSADSTSNKYDTFSFVEDFDDGNYNGWTVDSGSWSASDYYLKTTVDGSKIHTTNDVVPSGGKEILFRFKNHGKGSGNCDHHVYVIHASDSDYLKVLMWNYSSDTTYVRLIECVGSANFLHTNTKYNYYNEAGSWFWVKVVKDGSNGKFKIWKDGEEEPSSWDWEGTYNSDLADSGKIMDLAYTSSYGTGLDDIRIRAYSDPEPTTTVGSEYTNSIISGQVVLNSNPVQGAIVRAICQDDETYAGDTTTDENGNYTITGLNVTKKYHTIVEYTDPNTGQKYSAESKWDITPVESS